MKRMHHTIPVKFLVLLAVFLAAPGLAGDETLFLPEMDRAVDRAIESWKREDMKNLRKALKDLALNEAYLLAVGASNPRRSYLGRVPQPLADNPAAVGAFLFVLRQEREGNMLLPVHQFEGKYFQFREVSP